jgi:porphyrinogen peroxidase
VSGRPVRTPAACQDGAVTEPQPVLYPLTESAVFLTLEVAEGGEQQARDLLEGLAGLNRSVGFRVPDEQLSGIVGIGSRLWDRLFTGPRPPRLHPFQELVGARHTAPATPGDLLLHLRSRHLYPSFELARLALAPAGDAIRVVDEVHGFRYFDLRDLLGFVDGTENPVGPEAAAAALLDDPDDPFDGGSYVIVQKYLHDLSAWQAMSVEQQEHSIGRTKLDDVELADDVKPLDSHVAVNTIVDPDGTEHDILRDNMPFGSLRDGEFGTYFIGYAADPSITERMLRRMFIGEPEGTHDRILDVSTAVTGGLFFVPSQDFLDDLPPAPAAPAAQAAPAVPEEPARAGGLGIGSLR